MKLYCFLLFALLQFSSIGQITYTLVFVDQCSGVIEDRAYWVITDLNGNEYETDDRFKHNSFYLPQTGTYRFQFPFDTQGSIEIEIKSNNQTDTIYYSNLEIPLIISNPPPTRYRLCNEIAEGYCADYYQKGKLRREGTFKNGHPIDTVKTYYFSGQMKKLVIPLSNGYNYVYYYRNGNKESEYNSVKRIEKEYYESGQLSLLRHLKKRGRTTEVEFYENGEVKRKSRARKEIRYSSQGNKSEQFKRTRTYGFFDWNYRSYLIRWKKFDTQGNVQKEIIFERMEREHPRFPEKLTQIDSTDFEEIILFENGNPIQKVVVNTEYVNHDFVYEIVVFKMENKNWIETRKGSLEDLLEFL